MQGMAKVKVKAMNQNSTQPGAAEGAGLAPAERSLLLYLETRAVDHGGLVDAVHMNQSDVETARQWASKGFIRFSRVLSEFFRELPSMVTGRREIHYVVELTDESWAAVAAERKARAKRIQNKKIVSASLEHFESLRK
jgi:hypothetical protein